MFALDVARGYSTRMVEGAGVTEDEYLDVFSRKCIRLDYHDGPCNGLPRKQCELKAKLEREGKIMKLGPVTEEQKALYADLDTFKSRSVRGWLKQIWYQLVGKA